MRQAVFLVSLESMEELLPLLRDEGLRLTCIQTCGAKGVYVCVKSDALPEAFENRIRFATLTLRTERYGSQHITRIEAIEPSPEPDDLEFLKKLFRVEERADSGAAAENAKNASTSVSAEHNYVQAKPIRKIEVDAHSNTLVYYEGWIEPHGFVTVQTWADGLEVWVGGQCRWRSWKP